MYTIILSIIQFTLLSFQCDTFFSFLIALDKISGAVQNKNGDNRHLVSFLALGRKISIFLH